MAEKRGHDRTPTLIAGRIVSDSLNVPISIVELSPTGARLQIPPGLFLPKRFMVRALELGEERPVEVVWRNKNQVGVRF